jgi:hypothetical protein
LLVEAGFEPADTATAEVIDRWRGSDVGEIEQSNSVRYLKDTGQLADLDFVLAHVDDLGSTYVYDGTEIVELGAA